MNEFLKFTGIFVVIAVAGMATSFFATALICIGAGFEPGSDAAGFTFIAAAIPTAYAILKGTVKAADWIID